MITTYLIEDLKSKQVLGYYKRLWHAKLDLCNFEDPNNRDFGATQYRILCLKGPYYGEGRHAYQVTYCGKVFLTEKL